MRMPAFEDLSKEQDRICLFAPLDGATLISGPPGTGKTVVAFYRAETVARKGETPRVVMFNNVLRRYSSNASRLKIVRENVNTYFSWFAAWWQSVFNSWYPQLEPYVLDWEKMVPRVLALNGNNGSRNRALAGWGNLILDEGQDLPPNFYMIASIVLFLAQGTKPGSVALTVLADENQRLNAHQNSSLDEIRKMLNLADARQYKLTRNYRNTFEIAAAAAHFYCGLKTGIPLPPEGRHGARPRMQREDTLDRSVDAIVRFVRNQSDLEIGVFLPTQKLQTTYFNKLKYRLADEKGVKVQRFTSGDELHGDADSLQFDQPGTVTVLCDQSCKGLEFDAVFIPELQARKWDPASIDQMRMQFYVLSSRARTHLTFLYSAAQGEPVPILEQFPGRSSNLLEWIDG